MYDLQHSPQVVVFFGVFSYACVCEGEGERGGGCLCVCASVVYIMNMNSPLDSVVVNEQD